jgi:predicted secreted protein
MRDSLQGLVAVFAAIVLGACSPVRPDQATGSLVLTVNDSGRAVSIGVGQELVVRLAANPTTGYRWLLVASNESVVEVQGDSVFVQDTAPSGAVGVGGVEIWRFRETHTGHQALSFEYRRTWEDPSSPVQAVTYSITVR